MGFLGCMGLLGAHCRTGSFTGRGDGRAWFSRRTCGPSRCLRARRHRPPGRPTTHHHPVRRPVPGGRDRQGRALRRQGPGARRADRLTGSPASISGTGLHPLRQRTRAWRSCSSPTTSITCSRPGRAVPKIGLRKVVISCALAGQFQVLSDQWPPSESTEYVRPATLGSGRRPARPGVY